MIGASVKHKVVYTGQVMLWVEVDNICVELCLERYAALCTALSTAW